MEHATQKRVNRKARPNKALKELSLSPLPSPPQRRKKAGKSIQRPKPKKEKEKEEYWRLDVPAYLRAEQREDGRYLLLNWADIDPATGKKYEPTWVSHLRLRVRSTLTANYR